MLRFGRKSTKAPKEKKAAASSSADTSPDAHSGPPILSTSHAALNGDPSGYSSDVSAGGNASPVVGNYSPTTPTVPPSGVSLGSSSGPGTSPTASGISAATKREPKSLTLRRKDKDKWRNSIVISQPINFQHALHVGQNFEWTSANKPGEEFQFLEKLGEGSYGTAYKAVHGSQSFVVAIKVVMMGTNAVENLKLQRELDILKTCRDPHVVSFFGCCFVDADMWILMEYCSGGSLRDILDNVEGGLKEAYIAAVCADTVMGLVYLHKKNIVHNDIKASNILLTDDGVAKIADFGVSEQLSQSVTNGGGGLVGTPYWMAPEVIANHKSDFPSDIWSLGITAIELAEGFPPHIQLSPMLAMRMIPHKPAPALTDKRKSKWSKQFHDFLTKCLDKDPAKRSSAEQLLSHPFIKKGTKSSLLHKSTSLQVSSTQTERRGSKDILPPVVPGFEGSKNKTIHWHTPTKPAGDNVSISSGSSIDEPSETRPQHAGTFVSRPNLASLFMFRSRSRDLKSVGTQTDPPSFWSRLTYLFAGCCAGMPVSQLDIEEKEAQLQAQSKLLKRSRPPTQASRGQNMFTETDPLIHH